MGSKALGGIEIVPTRSFYDYEAKYSVNADMVAAGELEGGHEGMEGAEEEESEESEEEVEINERKKYGGNKGDVPASKRGDKKDTAEEEGVEDYKKKLKEMKIKIMATSNFHNENASAIFAVQLEHEFDYDDLVENLKSELNNDPDYVDYGKTEE